MPLFTNEEVVSNTPLPVDGSGVTQPVSGTVTANAGTGTFLVDGSAHTQPVSGTVTANAGTGTFLVDGSAHTQPISAAALPLPTGAATEATLATLLTSATFTGRINTFGQKTMANSTPVVIASDQSALPVVQGGTGTATVTSNSVGTSAVTLATSNSARIKIVIFNEAGTLYVKLGSAASSTDYSYRLTANTTLEVDTYYGVITAAKQSGTTNVQVTTIGV